MSKRLAAAAILGGGVAALTGIVALAARQEPQHIARFPDDDWATWTLADVAELTAVGDAELTLGPDPYHAAIAHSPTTMHRSIESVEAVALLAPRPNRPRAA